MNGRDKDLGSNFIPNTPFPSFKDPLYLSHDSTIKTQQGCKVLRFSILSLSSYLQASTQRPHTKEVDGGKRKDNKDINVEKHMIDRSFGE
jgi:hypothetical protein